MRRIIQRHHYYDYCLGIACVFMFMCVCAFDGPVVETQIYFIICSSA